MGKTCSCFGHRQIEITDELKARLSKILQTAVSDGISIFLFGGLSEFDELVYDAVTELKHSHPDQNIQRIFCFPQYKHLRKHPHWFIPKDYEELYYPPLEYDYWYTSLYYRNCAMIDQSDLVLFWVEERQNSGAYKAYQYAVKKHKNVLNLR